MMAMAMVHGWCRYRRHACHQPTGSSADTTRTARAAIARLPSGPADVGGALGCPAPRRFRKLSNVPCANGCRYVHVSGAANNSQPVTDTVATRARMAVHAAVPQLRVTSAARVMITRVATSM